MQAFFSFLMLGDASQVSAEEEEEEEASSCSLKQIMHSTNTLDDHALFLLECIVNKHLFTNLVSLC